MSRGQLLKRTVVETAMTNRLDIMEGDAAGEPSRPIRMALLLCGYIIVCCLAFRLSYPHYRESYVLYDAARLPYALAVIAGFSMLALLLVFVKFSFGYLISFYFYSMVLGYLWLNCFSKFQYDHVLAGVSAAVSTVAFLLPALLVTSPIGRRYEMPERWFWRLLTLIVLLCAATSAVAAAYNFRIVSVNDIYDFRDQLRFPTIVNYAIGAATGVLLPFAFACFVVRGRNWAAIAVLLISVSFYPSTLSKTALFTPAWLVTLAVLSRFFDARATSILSLLLPILAGIVLILVIGEPTRRFFDIVIERMVIVPSSALDVYNEYFTRNPLTHFCQIWLVKPFVPCAFDVPLAVEMQNNYALGNYNASLFATEGIASVGLWLAPISVLVCGLVVGFGNRLSAGLPPRLILLSAGILPLILQNVPFSTTLVTHGLLLLFALWYITPRSVFRPGE